MRKIMFICNVASAMKLFRLELLEKLQKESIIWMVAKFSDDELVYFNGRNFNCINVDIDRRGKSIINDSVLFYKYITILNKIKPDVVLTYTIKPNIYGLMACKIKNIYSIATVEGLGSLFFGKKFFLAKLIKFIYGRSLNLADKVFYLNDNIKSILKNIGVDEKKLKYTPGMGVNVNKFCLLPYEDNRSFNVLTIGRIMREKGFDEMVAAMDDFYNNHADLKWYICGKSEIGEEDILDKLLARPWVRYLGQVSDTRKVYGLSHVVLSATYHEGLSTVCLEASACGRPIIGSNIPGVKEVIDDGITGYLFTVKNSNEILEKLEQFYQLPFDKKILMGKMGRAKIMKYFNREKVNNIYIDTIYEKC